MKPIIFYGHSRGKYMSFSNFFHAPFVIDGITYQWSEQYIMAQKAILFDPEMLKKIMVAKTPAECKKLGRKVKGFDAEKWAAVCEELSYPGILAKFRQNPNIGSVLVSTGDALIAEARDRIWGCGLTKKEAEKTSPEEWPGKNHLGNILMKVRAELRKEWSLFPI